MSKEREALSKLRTSLDGADSFVNGGHSIINVGGATKHAERMMKVPTWVLSDTKVKELIQKRFPRLNTNRREHKAARKTVCVIYLYYRVGLTAAATAEVMGMSRKAVKRILERLNGWIKSNKTTRSAY
ncbi:MAG TPA: hypothetical protein VFA52_04425 [Candidatus Paceibacterota bacterium]|jgi:hypothetical protein|nr:hypothetical protein [Candidatus Paceibacterota bacterium]